MSKNHVKVGIASGIACVAVVFLALSLIGSEDASAERSRGSIYVDTQYEDDVGVNNITGPSVVDEDGFNIIRAEIECKGSEPQTGHFKCRVDVQDEGETDWTNLLWPTNIDFDLASKEVIHPEWTFHGRSYKLPQTYRVNLMYNFFQC